VGLNAPGVDSSAQMANSLTAMPHLGAVPLRSVSSPKVWDYGTHFYSPTPPSPTSAPRATAPDHEALDGYSQKELTIQRKPLYASAGSRPKISPNHGIRLSTRPSQTTLPVPGNVTLMACIRRRLAMPSRAQRQANLATPSFNPMCPTGRSSTASHRSGGSTATLPHPSCPASC
jgi:hypothetical protein